MDAVWELAYSDPFLKLSTNLMLIRYTEYVDELILKAFTVNNCNTFINILNKYS